MTILLTKLPVVDAEDGGAVGEFEEGEALVGVVVGERVRDRIGAKVGDIIAAKVGARVGDRIGD